VSKGSGTRAAAAAARRVTIRIVSTAPENARFATTRWTVVVASAGAGPRASPAARDALATLCQTYWYPLYAYARRRGNGTEDAADLVQGFFAALLERDALAAADRTRGRFRAFLLASFDHYAANEWRRATAGKRGGGRTVTGLDFTEGERRFNIEPSHDLTPQRVYEQRWAQSLVDDAMAQLRSEYEARNRLDWFDAISPIVGGAGEDAYVDLAARLNATEGAVKVAVHRFRARCRELLRDAVARTVASDADVEDELRELFGAT
jgi:RNA polymerase sigma factor (sigma-70 family)